jgi:hypothetical protein
MNKLKLFIHRAPLFVGRLLLVLFVFAIAFGIGTAISQVISPDQEYCERQ